MKKVWELEDLELKTASVGDANRDYTWLASKIPKIALNGIQRKTFFFSNL